MGGSKSPECNSVARQIHVWDYCVERNIWINASHLPGCENTEADRETRYFNDRTEWQLESDVYYSITKQFGQPSIVTPKLCISIFFYFFLEPLYVPRETGNNAYAEF